MVAEELVPDPVQFVGGDPGRDVPADLGEGLGGDTPGDPHSLDRLGVLDVRFADPRVLLAHIFGGLDRRRNLTHRGHAAGPRNGSARTGRERRLRTPWRQPSGATRTGTLPTAANERKLARAAAT